MPFAVIGAAVPEGMKDLLCTQGYDVITLPCNPRLSGAVAAHPDLSVFFAPDAVYTTAGFAEVAGQEFKEICRRLGCPLRIVRGEIGTRYPQDILLDALPIEHRLFCLPEQTAPELTARTDFCVVPVRQGYAKCAALAVGDHALASADPSLLRAAEQCGLDTLALLPGGIRLQGYDTGFIGGAASFAPRGDCSDICFCGDLKLYPGGEALEAFLAAHGIRAYGLSGVPLSDVGTIFLFGGDQNGTA